MKKRIAAVLAALQLFTVTAFAANPYPPQRPEIGVMMVEQQEMYDITVGLRSDGTINVRGNKREIPAGKFTDIVDVTVVNRDIIALKSDGTVVYERDVNSNSSLTMFNGVDLSEVLTWTDIVDIEGGRNHVVGLEADGTVVGTGDNTYNQCSFAGWENISKIYAEYNATIGITKNGQVRTTGEITNTDVDFYSLRNVKTMLSVHRHSSGINEFYPILEDGSSPFKIDAYTEEELRNFSDFGKKVPLKEFLEKVGITEEVVRMDVHYPFGFGSRVYVLDAAGNFYEIILDGRKIDVVNKLPAKIVQYVFDGVDSNGYCAVAENGRIYSNKFRYDSADWVLTTNIDIDGYAIPSDVAPYIKDGRTLAPVRAILEALGMTVSWNPENRVVTATKGDIVIEVIIDNNTAYINGVPKELDVAPEITRDRTFVPVRFFAEALGLTVEWDAYNKTVMITSK